VTEPEDLASLMQRYQEGDAAAFQGLYRAVADRVYGYLVRSTGDRTTADDLLQEVFLNIHRARATYRPGSPVLPWAFAIARHAAASRARSVGRRAKREESREDLSDAPAPETETASDPRLDEIQTVIDALPAQQREALLLLKVSGLSLKEAAAATGSTVGAVKLRAHRAYEAIRKHLGASKKEDAA
jgi:RNA polymerase sigma-70 factor (ECF subfamily)